MLVCLALCRVAQEKSTLWHSAVGWSNNAKCAKSGQRSREGCIWVFSL